MPLRDHFHPPLSQTDPWESFQASWPAMITQQLNQGGLPQGYKAWPRTRVEASTGRRRGNGHRRGRSHAVYSPPPPPLKTPVEFPQPDLCEVLVVRGAGRGRVSLPLRSSVPGTSIARASEGFRVELRPLPETRVAVVVVDIVTDRGREFPRGFAGIPELSVEGDLQAPGSLYAVAYRDYRRRRAHASGSLAERLALGSPLPTCRCGSTPTGGGTRTSNAATPLPASAADRLRPRARTRTDDQPSRHSRVMCRSMSRTTRRPPACLAQHRQWR